MADFTHFAGFAPAAGAAPAGQAQRMLRLGGAVVSVALVAGMCLWGYRIAVRDVSGVPVIRALAGPMRVAPDDPGGEVMAHQGLAVNAVAAEGAAAAPADRLVLAPRPVELTEEDIAGTLAPPPPPVSSRAETVAGLAIAAPPAPRSTEEAIAAAVAEALESGGGGLAEPVELSGSLDAAEAGAEAGTPERVIVAAAMPGGVAGPGLRPMPRPARGPAPAPAPAPTAAAATAAAATAAPATEIAAATLAPGTRLVQLGAFESAEAARTEWDRLAGLFPQIAGKARVVEAAEAGGRAFWRLRAHGFAGEDDSRRFCADILAAGRACIPVAQR